MRCAAASWPTGDARVSGTGWSTTEGAQNESTRRKPERRRQAQWRKVWRRTAGRKSAKCPQQDGEPVWRRARQQSTALAVMERRSGSVVARGRFALVFTQWQVGGGTGGIGAGGGVAEWMDSASAALPGPRADGAVKIAGGFGDLEAVLEDRPDSAVLRDSAARPAFASGGNCKGFGCWRGRLGVGDFGRVHRVACGLGR